MSNQFWIYPNAKRGTNTVALRHIHQSKRDSAKRRNYAAGGKESLTAQVCDRTRLGAQLRHSTRLLPHRYTLAFWCHRQIILGLRQLKNATSA
ncbi:hypothetical protein CEXT_339301 [Caerostris extrusa]|uniref:Uncharacterized protein n=1 Tax=Caerostris extrusa TaxID=172846 RepID=A0AAV4TQQ6_CAEEX|nr:hypothetical protein CEXT_339301 [Caerostris extrusa]